MLNNCLKILLKNIVSVDYSMPASRLSTSMQIAGLVRVEVFFALVQVSLCSVLLVLARIQTKKKIYFQVGGLALALKRYLTI